MPRSLRFPSKRIESLHLVAHRPAEANQTPVQKGEACKMEASFKPSGAADRVYGNFDGEIEPAGGRSIVASWWALLSNTKPRRMPAKLSQGLLARSILMIYVCGRLC